MRVCARARGARARARCSSAPAAEAEIVDDVSHVNMLAAMLGVEDGLSHLHVGGLAAPAMKVPARIGAPSANGPGGPGASGPTEVHALTMWEHSPALHQSPRLMRSKRVSRRARKSRGRCTHVVPVHTAQHKRCEVTRREAARDEVGEVQQRVVHANIPVPERGGGSHGRWTAVVQ